MKNLKAAVWLLGALSLGVAGSFTINHLTVFDTRAWPWSLGFLVALFLVLMVVYSRKKSPVELASALIGGFVIRFLCGLVFLLTFALLLRQNFLPLAIHFISHWLLFTLAEIAYLSGSTSPSHT